MKKIWLLFIGLTLLVPYAWTFEMEPSPGRMTMGTSVLATWEVTTGQ